MKKTSANQFIRLTLLLLTSLVIAIGGGCSPASDAEIQKNAESAIAEAGISGVSVVVTAGAARVSGEVRDDAERDRVIQLTRNAGAASVIDNLTIKPDSPTRFDTNPALKGRINDALRRAGCDGSDVTSNEKSIFIVGRVSEDKYVECIRVANTAAGEKIENNLEILKSNTSQK